MKTAFILHGVGGHPEENWFPWMKRELQKRGWGVTVPQFPHPSHPNLSEWLQDFSRFAEMIDEETMMVGHSLGATFMLRFLESHTEKIGTAAFVAGPIAALHNQFDPLIASFVDHPFDWEKIRTRANRFLAFYSNDDPYVPLSHGRELSDKLNADFHVIDGGGHLNQGSGYVQFPALLDALVCV